MVVHPFFVDASYRLCIACSLGDVAELVDASYWLCILFLLMPPTGCASLARWESWISCYGSLQIAIFLKDPSRSSDKVSQSDISTETHCKPPLKIDFQLARRKSCSTMIQIGGIQRYGETASQPVLYATSFRSHEM